MENAHRFSLGDCTAIGLNDSGNAKPFRPFEKSASTESRSPRHDDDAMWNIAQPGRRGLPDSRIAAVSRYFHAFLDPFRSFGKAGGTTDFPYDQVPLQPALQAEFGERTPCAIP